MGKHATTDPARSYTPPQQHLRRGLPGFVLCAFCGLELEHRPTIHCVTWDGGAEADHDLTWRHVRTGRIECA